jgi:hypothetical protein
MEVRDHICLFNRILDGELVNNVFQFIESCKIIKLDSIRKKSFDLFQSLEK